MTAQRHVHDILQPHVLPLMQCLPGAIVHEDNALSHTARLSQDCFHTVTILPWSARSTDLSPIKVSAADKGLRVYPLDHRPNAVALYSGCTPGKCHAWFLPDDRHTASLVELRGGWRHARMKFCFALMDPMLLCPVSKPDLLSTPEAEILKGFFDQSVNQVRKTTIKKCCFKCQRFGHSLTACRGQFTSSRCAPVGHTSTDCNLEQKCVNCS
ncbi:transposable element Tcb1 transposase [Trichonephila clavipes]|nr:transposable element Tcb1 transposase [Trichonephila clavipes]